MDDQKTQRNNAPLMDTMPLQHSNASGEAHYSHKREWKIAVIIVAIVIVVVGIALYIFKTHPAPLTPEQTLQSLDASSAPDTATIDQKSDTMNALSAHSRDTSSVSNDDQLNTLNSLSQ